MEEVTINGDTFRKVSASNDWKIVVLQRGWVFYGQVSKDGDVLRIDNARCIRVWGTSGGLAQLATDGPTGSTILEPPCVIEANYATVIYTINCKKWAI